MTVEAAAYASGDVIGGLLTIPNVFGWAKHSVKIMNVVFKDAADQGGEIEVIFFDSNPSASTFTENGAVTIADADLAKICGRLRVSSQTSFANNGILSADCEICVDRDSTATATAANDQSLYAVCVCRAARTQAAVSDLSISIGAERL
jgi:hypothetical protein